MKIHLTLVTVTAILLGIAGCTNPDNTRSETSSSPSVTAEEDAVAPETTATATESRSRETDPERIREGIYFDVWARNVATHFQAAANVYLHENDGRLSPGDLQTYLDKIIPSDTPDAFNVEAGTTAFDNFTIKVWHINGYQHFDEDTAYTAQSDPDVSTTPTPTASALEGPQRLDEETKKLLYEAGVAAGAFMRGTGGDVPTDDYMRRGGYIPTGWEWSISKGGLNSEYFLIRVWNPDAFLFNSEKAAASYSSFPQPELRPAYNFDVSPFVPITGFTLPDRGTTTAPAPTA